VCQRTSVDAASFEQAHQRRDVGRHWRIGNQLHKSGRAEVSRKSLRDAEPNKVDFVELPNSCCDVGLVGKDLVQHSVEVARMRLWTGPSEGAAEPGRQLAERSGKNVTVTTPPKKLSKERRLAGTRRRSGNGKCGRDHLAALRACTEECACKAGTVGVEAYDGVESPTIDRVNVLLLHDPLLIFGAAKSRHCCSSLAGITDRRFGKKNVAEEHVRPISTARREHISLCCDDMSHSPEALCNALRI
jgi:hypothetical protein